MTYISVVVPVYMSEDCIKELCDRLKCTLLKITEKFEIILIDDRSTDRSWLKIQHEALVDNRVRGILLSKNFGQHRAITAGLDIAVGNWVVVMDCDLQDPPEAILDLYKKAREGYEVVVASFQTRKESKFRRWSSNIFWKVLTVFSGMKFDPMVGNYRIMSSRVVTNIKKYREQLRLLGGLISLMGFTTATINVNREARFSGKSSYKLSKLISVAAEIVIAYSDKPLKYSVYLGLCTSFAAFTVGLYFLYLKFIQVVQVSGWASVIVSFYLIGGIIIANLGIIGIYIGKVYDETKRRPLYIIESETVNAE